MSNKKVKITILSILILLGVLFANHSYAKNLGMIDDFTIYGNRTRRTNYVLKDVDDRRYVLNLRVWGSSRIVVKSMIVNYYGQYRSSYWGETYEGTRNVFSNWAKGGYLYALDLKRQYYWDGGRNVDGSWSPDAY